MTASGRRQAWTLISREETGRQRRVWNWAKQWKSTSCLYRCQPGRSRDHGKTNQVLGFQLSKWRRTLKAMLIDFATKQNIYRTHYFTKYWLLRILKIYTCSGPISDLLNQNISSKRFWCPLKWRIPIPESVPSKNDLQNKNITSICCIFRVCL